MKSSNRRSFSLLRDLKLTQKIFFIFVLMIFLVANSWAFTFTTIVDFQRSFATVESYAFPSVIVTSRLKDEVHVALLSVYDYVSTGNTASKENYQDAFDAAVRSEYELFTLSQSAKDFIFTQTFNDKLVKIITTTDNLVTIYETQPDSPEVTQNIQELNLLRDDFNIFLESEITDQISQQIETTNTAINNTADTIRLYLFGVAAVIILIIIFVIIFISNNITKPVATLTAAAKSFGKGNFKKVQLKRNDELGLFADTFNTMATNIQASQTALKEELEKTKQLDQQKSEFLSIAAHQLRTPMAGIRWVTGMLYEGDMGELNAEQKHHLANALENINRMVNLINSLLDVTKIEEQKFQYNFTQQNFNELVKAAVGRFENAAKEKHIVMSIIGEKTPIMADVDQEKIELVLTNLIDNAIKYSNNKGTIEITLSNNQKNLTCAIQDHGIGIPKDSHNRVFTKFFRGQNVLKVVTEGSGLGLFMVKDIVLKHDGDINFTSEENAGSCFTFTLPLKQGTTKKSQPTPTSESAVVAEQ